MRYVRRVKNDPPHFQSVQLVLSIDHGIFSHTTKLAKLVLRNPWAGQIKQLAKLILRNPWALAKRDRIQKKKTRTDHRKGEWSMSV